MTTAYAPREGQRPDPSPAQGNALGTRATHAMSPERATQTSYHDSIAPSGLHHSSVANPGRCPGLSWTGPLALSTRKSQGQRPGRIQPRATPWVIGAIDLLQERRTALISAAVTGQIDVRHLAEATAA